MSDTQSSTDKLLADAARFAADYIAALADARVYPAPEALEYLVSLGGDLPRGPTAPDEVLNLLNRVASPATVKSTSGRYFGYVIGGALPAALAASWLAAAWDQNAFAVSTSPLAASLEEIALGWLLEILRLPNGCGGGFVTGATMASFTALAAARHAVLERLGWNVEDDGLIGAPPLSVIVSDEVHVSVLKALSMLGLGRNRVVRVRADAHGRMILAALPPLSSSTIVCTQAGNVNTGAFDPIGEICARARDAGAWVHVDGAFGLWAAATPSLAHLTDGIANADSWATDAHKWLNTPYDSGLVFVRDAAALRSAMALNAAYFVMGERREPGHFTPECSRRARGVEVWAAIRSLGAVGIAELVERTCRYAQCFAEELRRAGFDILNDVVLNQVMVAFGDAARTRRVIEAIERDGTCWCGATEWQGRTAMRISVSSWATTEADVERSIAAIIRIANATV